MILGACLYGAVSSISTAVLLAYEDRWSLAQGPYLHPSTLSPMQRLADRSLAFAEWPIDRGPLGAPLNGALAGVVAAWAVGRWRARSRRRPAAQDTQPD